MQKYQELGHIKTELIAYANDVARTLKKDTHIKARLLDQVMILFHGVPFQNGNFS